MEAVIFYSNISPAVLRKMSREKEERGEITCQSISLAFQTGFHISITNLMENIYHLDYCHEEAPPSSNQSVCLSVCHAFLNRQETVTEQFQLLF
jgi:hypothetical protein